MADEASDDTELTSAQLVGMAMRSLHGHDALDGSAPDAQPSKRADAAAAQVLATLALVTAVRELKSEMTRLGR